MFDKYSSCHEHQRDFETRGKSLFVVVPTAPTDNYEIFTKKVRDYNLKEPFKFQIPDFFTKVKYQKFVSIHAAYLYDSVRLYAQALDRLLSMEKLVSDEVVNEIVSNGTKIVETIIGLGSYRS